jgi:retron-type reverse transcriptase
MNELFSFKNLLKAYYNCRLNKRRTINAAKFELNFENELLQLEQDLKNKTYYPGQSICFAIKEPKLREVFAADFRDRIIHHLLINYFEPIFEPKFIFHSYACRKNKGAILAIKNLQKLIKHYPSNKQLFYLQIDIKAFFTSLDKNILFSIIKSHIKNPDILWLSKTIIFHNPCTNFFNKGDISALKAVDKHKSLFYTHEDKGLPIGNLSSQFFANLYLNELDQFAKHTLKIKNYFRYADDMIIIHQNSNKLKTFSKQIDAFLQNNLKLHLHPDKEILKPVSHGINFLGYIIKPNNILIRNRTVKKLKNKLFVFNKQILNQYPSQAIYLWTPELCEKFQHIFISINSYYGLFKHADTFRLRRHLYEKHFNILKLYLLPINDSYDYFIWFDF